MRLTHFVKLDQDERDSLQASICPAADAVGDASIRISQDVPGGPANVVWLTIAEHDVIADLVWAHRPDTAEEAPVVDDDTCPFKWNTGVGEKRCALSSGHETYPDWTHVSSEGWTFKPIPARPEF